MMSIVTEQHHLKNSFTAEEIASYNDNQENTVRNLLLTVQRLAINLQHQRQSSDNNFIPRTDVNTATTPTAAAQTEDEPISALVGKPCHVDLCLPSWMDPDEVTADVLWSSDSNSSSPLCTIPEVGVSVENQYIHVDIRRNIEESCDASCVQLSFVPCRSGRHLVFVRWRGDDVTESPICVSVLDATQHLFSISCRQRKFTFGDAASIVISKIKKNKIPSSNMGSKEKFRQLAVVANTVYGVTAAVLKRTSKLERSLSFTGQAAHLAQAANAVVKRRRVIQQIVSTTDGKHQQVIVSAGRTLKRQSSAWCLGQSNKFDSDVTDAGGRKRPVLSSSRSADAQLESFDDHLSQISGSEKILTEADNEISNADTLSKQPAEVSEKIFEEQTSQISTELLVLADSPTSKTQLKTDKTFREDITSKDSDKSATAAAADLPSSSVILTADDQSYCGSKQSSTGLENTVSVNSSLEFQYRTLVDIAEQPINIDRNTQSTRPTRNHDNHDVLGACSKQQYCNNTAIQSDEQDDTASGYTHRRQSYDNRDVHNEAHGTNFRGVSLFNSRINQRSNEQQLQMIRRASFMRQNAFDRWTTLKHLLAATTPLAGSVPQRVANRPYHTAVTQDPRVLITACYLNQSMPHITDLTGLAVGHVSEPSSTVNVSLVTPEVTPRGQRNSDERGMEYPALRRDSRSCGQHVMTEHALIRSTPLYSNYLILVTH